MYIYSGQAVSADQAEGKETLISNNPKAALLSRRSRCNIQKSPIF